MSQYPDNGSKFLRFYRFTTTHPTLRNYGNQKIAHFGPFQDDDPYLYGASWENEERYADPQGGAAIMVSTTRRFITGTPTATVELPDSGATAYKSTMAATFVQSDFQRGLGWQNEALSVDYVQHSIRGDFDAAQSSWTTGTEPLRVRLTLSASYEPANGRIAGTLRSADGAFAGRVIGRFYGPRAASVGLVLSMTWQGGIQPIAGVIIAKR
jgi:hypothetical protein